MHIFPAIDLYDKKAVRLYKGDYISDGIRRVKITGDEASLAYGYIHEKDHMLSDAAACCIDLVTRYYVPEI